MNAKVIAPQIEVSSCDLRERIKLGKTVRYQIPLAVETFIREQSLYR